MQAEYTVYPWSIHADSDEVTRVTTDDCDAWSFVDEALNIHIDDHGQYCLDRYDREIRPVPSHPMIKRKKQHAAGGKYLPYRRHRVGVMSLEAQILRGSQFDAEFKFGIINPYGLASAPMRMSASAPGLKSGNILSIGRGQDVDADQRRYLRALMSYHHEDMIQMLRDNAQLDMPLWQDVPVLQDMPLRPEPTCESDLPSIAELIDVDFAGDAKFIMG